MGNTTGNNGCPRQGLGFRQQHDDEKREEAGASWGNININHFRCAWSLEHSHIASTRALSFTLFRVHSDLDAFNRFSLEVGQRFCGRRQSHPMG